MLMEQLTFNLVRVLTEDCQTVGMLTAAQQTLHITAVLCSSEIRQTGAVLWRTAG
jgi:hypothetical protein